MPKYDPKKIERKWQQKWKESGIYEAKDDAKGKENHMLLTEFPYPSGNLHIGHWYAFAVPDILARYLRLKGKNLMYPMGFDAFGLPAENAAIKRGLNPRKWTEENIKHMTEQFETMGGSFDWSRRVSTIDPEYYKWTQWIFLKMFEKDLAYRKEVTVNWCPSCKTVLANEQVAEGACERCDSRVEQKKLEQWLYKTTKYADKLIDDLDDLDWPESTKLAQKNWIGRSEGATIKFKITQNTKTQNTKQNTNIKKQNSDLFIEVFTTRVDTIFGCTYCVVAPEHELVASLLDIKNQKSKIKNLEEIRKYVDKAKRKTDLQRTELTKNKTGVEIKGIKAINPFTNEAVPICVADYVLGHYGTGAVMAVPAHDERDFEFEKKYKLPVRKVIEPCFVTTSSEDKVRENEPFVERDAITAVVKHWKKDEYIILKWKQVGWKTFITGGPENSETMEEGARTEVLEETGYKNLKLIKELPAYHSKFYHVPKKLNRFVHMRVFLFELKNGEQQEISDMDQERHEVAWVPKKEIEKFLTPEAHKYVWKTLSEKENAYTDDGILVDSGEYSRMSSEKARVEMAKWLERKKMGGAKTTYRLHDWVISRQRYWGVPIPVIYCRKCQEAKSEKRKAKNFGKDKYNIAIIDGVEHAIVPVPEKDLSVELPELRDFMPTGDGKSPLAKAERWVRVKCPKCGDGAKRETDTMDTFVDSSWYFIRYADPKNKKKFADPAKMKKWLPVPMYIGGAEHNTMHLLYSRFFTKVLHDLKLIHFDEPFTGRRNHGIILGPDNQKMSKSRGNVIDPDAEVEKWGADSVRMYLAFMGPYDQNASWQMTGIVGMRRFLEKVWGLAEKTQNTKTQNTKQNTKHKTQNTKIEALLHKTIKKVTDDVENFRFNTAISQMMIFLNSFYKVYDYNPKKNIRLMARKMEGFLRGYDFKKFIILLSPFAPHIAEELWEKLGHKESIFLEKWPKPESKYLKDDEITLIVQVNGRVRDQIEAAADAGERDVKEMALASEKIKKYIPNEDNIRKVIFVPGRLINFVV